MPRLRPLRHKLAFLISALLVAVVGAFGWFANDRVHKVVEDAAAARLADASVRVARMLSESAIPAERTLLTLAASPEVQRPFAAPAPGAAQGAARLLGAAPPGTPPRGRALFARDCTLLAASGPAVRRPHCSPGVIRRMSPFRLRGDSVEYQLSVPVVAAAGDTVGALAETFVLTGAGVSAVENLIGTGSRLRVGNAAGDLWTDLARPVSAPARLQLDGVPYHLEDGNGEGHLVVARPVPEMPWVLAVQLPHATIVAPARTLMVSILIAALVALLIGAVGAYRISHHVTAPLEQIKSAAAGIAAGDYSQRVAVERDDELGELAAMFNGMAAQVETATDDLKAQALELEERMDALQTARRDTRAAHSLLDDVLASAPVGVAVFDDALRPLKVNAALGALTGLRAEAGEAPMAGMDSASRAHIEPLLREVIATGAPIVNERISMRQAASTRHWLTSLFPVHDHDGATSGVGLVVLDTTAHQELEERYLQSQKMDAVGRLAGGVAHDFNNLLTVILSYTSLALDAAEAGSELEAELREVLEAGERAASLTRQLLAFSRHQVMQPQRVSLNEIAINMERMLQRLIGEDVTLELQLADDLWTVCVDPGQVEQVIMNLAVNARDAMPTGGLLRIETQNSWVTSELSAELGASAGEYVTLTVEDTGVGMTWEVQRHLFEPFFTTKEAGKGTGLGLATVYGIVRQSAGDIRVQSAPGEGSRFTIYFPVARGEAIPALSLPASGVAATGTETVLLLEDDPAVQTLGSRLLRRAGYTVLDARTPAVAIQIARTHPEEIHLLLTDVVLPEMNGAEAAALITGLRPRLRTLFMSGYTADEIVRRGVSSDPSQFLQKPFTPTELTRKIRDVLDRPPAVAAAGLA